MRVVCLSDTHNRHSELRVPEGDLLVHAGDATMRGEPAEIRAFDDWLGRLPHRHKIVIAGNHDWLFERDPTAARELITNAIYLQDTAATIGHVRVWGSPWQPWFFDWAFNLQRGAPLKDRWDLIPSDTDLLITHGPPHGVRDEVHRPLARTNDSASRADAHVGCEELLTAIARVRPRLHVFGHIHEGYGQETRGETTFVNASNCDRSYRPINPPVVVDLA